MKKEYFEWISKEEELDKQKTTLNSKFADNDTEIRGLFMRYSFFEIFTGI